MKNLELKAVLKPQSNKEYLIKLTNSSQWVISKYISKRGWSVGGKIYTGIKEVYLLPSYKKSKEDEYQPEEITFEELEKKRQEIYKKEKYQPTDEHVRQIIQWKNILNGFALLQSVLKNHYNALVF